MAYTPANWQTTAEALKRQREYAKALRESQPDNSPFYGWANGLSDVSKALMGNYLNNNANSKELAFNANVNDKPQDFLNQYPDTGGGNQPTTADAGAPTTTASADGTAAPQPPFSPSGRLASLTAPSQGYSASKEAKDVNTGNWQPVKDPAVDEVIKQLRDGSLSPPSGGETMSGRTGGSLDEVESQIKDPPIRNNLSAIRVASNDASVPSGGPVQMAQARPTNDLSSMPPIQLQRDYGRLLSELGRAGMTPEAAQEMANSNLRLRMGLMPQATPNPLGQNMITGPGRMPSYENGGTPIQGFQGPVSTFGKGPLEKQRSIDPATGRVKDTIVPLAWPDEGSGASIAPNAPQTPAPASPAGAITQTPSQPAPASPAPAAMVSTPQPMDVPTALASLDKNFVPSAITAQTPLGFRPTAQTVAQSQSLPTSDPSESVWRGYLKDAEKEPLSVGLLGGKPSLQQIMKNKDTDSALTYDPDMENWQKKQFEKYKADTEEFTKQYTGIREAGDKADLMKPQLKIAKALANSGGLEQGPFARTITEARGALQEIAKATGHPEIADWAGGAAPNQVFTKIISGSMLQSLRSFIGPNAGQFRNVEIALLEKAFGNQNLTPEANQAVMEMIDRLNDRVSLIDKMAIDYKRHRGSLDDNFNYATKQLQENNPIYSKKEIDKLDDLISKKDESAKPAAQPAPPSKGFFPQSTPVDPNRADRFKRLQ